MSLLNTKLRSALKLASYSLKSKLSCNLFQIVLLIVLSAVPALAHSAHITWTASTSSNVTYELFRVQCTTPQANKQTITLNGVCTGTQSTLATGIAGTAFDDLTIQPGQSYEYFLRSVDSTMTESPNSTTVLITVAPTAPTGVVIGSHN